MEGDLETKEQTYNFSKDRILNYAREGNKEIYILEGENRGFPLYNFLLMKRLKVKRYQEGEFEDRSEKMAEETYLQLVVNGQQKFRVSITPGLLEDFAVGFLFCEGFIESPEEIKDIEIFGNPRRAIARVSLDGEVSKELEKLKEEIIWSECGATVGSKPSCREKTGSFRIPGSVVLEGSRRALEETEAFSETGAYHYAFLIDREGQPREKAKDIGRHNAVDKVVGKALSYDDNLREKYLFTTGRISSDIVLKCVRSGVPLVVSRGAPLHRSVRFGKQYGLGIVGFLRGKRFNIYSGEERIIRD